MSSIIKRFFSVFCVVLLFSFSGYATTTDPDPDMDDTTKVICNIIGYVWGIGGPLMTVVIIGAALLAIFGRMPWPALFALGMFCGVFFGAKTIITKIMPNINNKTKAMLEKCGK
ncbi:TrbC/VirB2 family protein [Wolbachia endosymbiont (group A) of Andrena hattorfiana]|uniref:TrbC/VirB2 family protein n=1 Tax=Wolbachia endosymbiont (group A) of Andrena hattorfiana TaxID=2953977 RepID=UPI0021F86F69|nr:TrbC/VirB2 family protein [Wolbachia endosymbiont (group A) of Andrena hattorfiana]